MNEYIFKKLRRLPIIGSIFKILNSYAYSGSKKNVLGFAPLSKWWSRVLKKMFYTFLFTEVLFIFSAALVDRLNWEPADTILSSFPSILGFGIGVFALMFVMPNEFLNYLDERRDSMSFGPEVVPVDMAYPLLVFIMVMALAGVNKIFPNDPFRFISAWAFFYGLVITLELVSFLYASSVMIQKLSLGKKESSKLTKNKEKDRQ